MWLYNGKQNLPQIIFLQRKFKKCLARNRYSTYRQNLLCEFKQEKIYSNQAQIENKLRILSRIKREQLPYANLDSKHLEFTHGLNFHQQYLPFYAAQKLEKTYEPDESIKWWYKPYEQKGKEEEQDETWQNLLSQKIYTDLQKRFEDKRAEVKREHILQVRIISL